MQISQAKVSYRIPLVGGVTDYPQYYHDNNAKSICCTINKFLHVSIERNEYGGLNICSKADLPWGIGLGSSGAFHSALVIALSKSRKRNLSRLRISELSYELETGIDKFATGRQDSVACLYKGISLIKYHPDDSVTVKPIRTPRHWQNLLSTRLLLFDTGLRRHARDSIKDILSKKNKNLLDDISKLPDLLLDAWKSNDMDFLGTALNLQEQYRSRLSLTCRSKETDEFLSIARKFGGGARLTGAGIGCLLCYCPEDKQRQLRRKLNIPEIKFSILWQ